MGDGDTCGHLHIVAPMSIDTYMCVPHTMCMWGGGGVEYTRYTLHTQIVIVMAVCLLRSMRCKYYTRYSIL